MGIVFCPLAGQLFTTVSMTIRIAFSIRESQRKADPIENALAAWD
jgi:hypothetical protein